MVKPERHNNRDLRYSKWHREKLPGFCYATDLDWIEWRPDKGIVAFIEAKIGISTPISKFQISVFEELEEKTGVPFFIVNHTEDMDLFKVTRKGRVERLDEAAFIEFMKQLGIRDDFSQGTTSLGEAF